MGLVSRRQDDDQQLPGSGLTLDLDQRACPVCRREVPPWQMTCPDDGTPTVHVTELPARDTGVERRDWTEPDIDGS